MMANEEQRPTMQPVKLLNYQEEKHKFTDKMKENPLFPIGIGGFVGLVGYNLFKIVKNRKGTDQKLPLSLQLIHTRMYAQGFVIGTLSLGVMYMLGTRIYALATHQQFNDPFDHSKDQK